MKGLIQQARELMEVSVGEEPSAEMADTLWAMMHEYQKAGLHVISPEGHNVYQSLRQEWMRHRY